MCLPFRARKDMIKPIKPPERTFGFGGLIMNKEFKSKSLFFLMVQDLNSLFVVLFGGCVFRARGGPGPSATTRKLNQVNHVMKYS